MIRAGIRRAFRLALRTDRQWRRDVDDEIALHLMLRTEQLIADGMPRDRAVEEAVRKFGRPEESRARLIEAARHREQRMHRAESLDNFRQDVSFAFRSLSRQKGWTAVTIATIALGIGATTAVFSVASSLLLHPLPYPNAGRIVLVYQQPSTGNNTGINVRITAGADLIRLWKREAKNFEAMEAYATSRVALRTAAEPVRLYGASVGPGFPAFAGERPMFGRMFTAKDIETNAPVVLLGEQAWRLHFGADTSVVGRTVWLNDSAATVIGVLPATLQPPPIGAPARDVWRPLDLRNDKLSADIIARLRPGATATDAVRELDVLFARYGGFADGKAPYTTLITTPAQSVQFHDSLVMLSWAVGLVLLVAFANVVHLVMTRANSRDRELAIRAALGAGRLRLFWQLLTESLVLTISGSACGILLGWVALRGIIGLRPQSLAALAVAHLDGTTLAVALVLTLIAGLAFALIGAMQSSRRSTNDSLKGSPASSSATRHRGGARALLVISEMALSTTLVVCATMVIRSVVNMQQADLGFSPAHLFAVTVAPPKSRYPTAASRAEIVGRAVERIRRMPGVLEAAVTSNGPGQRSFSIGRLEIEGEQPPPAASSSFIDVNAVEAGYFRAMGIRLTAGRVFSDTTGASRQVIINDGFARAHWPGASALGHRLRIAQGNGGSTVPDVPWLTIVGVAANASTGGAAPESTAPMLYTPSELSQNSVLMVRGTSAVDPTPAVRAIVRSIDPAVTVDVTDVERQMARSLAAPRFMMLLLSIFTVLALVLSAIGLYGVMSFAVAQRTREIGIRVALGASTQRIAQAVVIRGVGLAVVGAAAGTVAATWGTRFIEHELYGVTRSDFSSFAIAVSVLIGAAALACVVPMRRAIGVDPIRAIRAE